VSPLIFRIKLILTYAYFIFLMPAILCVLVMFLAFYFCSVDDVFVTCVLMAGMCEIFLR
jgi:hypothetical protein